MSIRSNLMICPKNISIGRGPNVKAKKDLNQMSLFFKLSGVRKGVFVWVWVCVWTWMFGFVKMFTYAMHRLQGGGLLLKMTHLYIHPFIPLRTEQMSEAKFA